VGFFDPLGLCAIAVEPLLDGVQPHLPVTGPPQEVPNLYQRCTGDDFFAPNLHQIYILTSRTWSTEAFYLPTHCLDGVDKCRYLQGFSGQP
jgi:hypothetical protein